MTLQWSAPTAGAAHGAMPAQPGAPVRERLTEDAPVVRDLRGRTGCGPYSLDLTAGDVVVVSGLPGSGKSTLIRRAVQGRAIDSQNTRDSQAAALPGLLPYALYRPWSAPRTTSASGTPCAPVNPSSCTTAAPRPGYAAGSPGTP